MKSLFTQSNMDSTCRSQLPQYTKKWNEVFFFIIPSFRNNSRQNDNTISSAYLFPLCRCNRHCTHSLRRWELVFDFHLYLLLIQVQCTENKNKLIVVNEYTIFNFWFTKKFHFSIKT